MFHSILFTVGLSLAGAGPLQTQTGCQSHLSEATLQRLKRVINRLLPEDEGFCAAERTRLNDLVVAFTADLIRPLDPPRRRQFLDVLAHPRRGTTMSVQNGTPKMESTDGIFLSADENEGLYLHVGHQFGESFVAYLQLIHGVSHLSRAVTGAPTVAEQNAGLQRLTLRWMGLYREQVAGAKDEYRFLRWAYRSRSLDKVESLLAPPPRASARLVLGNQQYLLFVRNALTLSPRDFIRRAVPLADFQDDQRFYARERWRTGKINQIRNISPWLARHVDRATADLLHLLERPPLMTKDSSSR